MPEAIEIRILDWPAAREYARPMRERVFIDEQAVPRDMEWDAWDDVSEHALAAVGGVPVGTARLLPDGRIGRMAVLFAWRRRGVGSRIMEALLLRAQARGMRSVTLHAQTQAAGFYRRFGFIERGEMFLEAGIAHVEMSLRLFPVRA